MDLGVFDKVFSNIEKLKREPKLAPSDHWAILFIFKINEEETVHKQLPKKRLEEVKTTVRKPSMAISARERSKVGN